MAGGKRDDVHLACARSGAKAGGETRGDGGGEARGESQEARRREESAARGAAHGGRPPLPRAALDDRDHQVRRGLPVAGRPALKLSFGVGAPAPREASESLSTA